MRKTKSRLWCLEKGKSTVMGGECGFGLVGWSLDMSFIFVSKSCSWISPRSMLSPVFVCICVKQPPLF